MNTLNITELQILNELRKKPLTIKELKQKLYSWHTVATDFYHDLNFLIVYRKILKFTHQGKDSVLVFTNKTMSYVATKAEGDQE